MKQKNVIVNTSVKIAICDNKTNNGSYTVKFLFRSYMLK